MDVPAGAILALPIAGLALSPRQASGDLLQDRVVGQKSGRQGDDQPGQTGVDPVWWIIKLGGQEENAKNTETLTT
jgi:hypothetical protein